MPIQNYSRLWLLLAVTGTLFADNVVVLPSGSNSNNNTAYVFGGDPLAQISSFQVQPGTFTILAKPTTNSANATYYAISNADTQSITVLNGNFQPINVPFAFGGATGAAITPDGTKLLLTGGAGLTILNTANNTLTSIQNAPIGALPDDVLVTPDSRYAFIISNYSQRLSAIDLIDNSFQGSMQLPNISKGLISISPTGLLYVSAHNRVLEIDTQTRPFSSKAIRRQWAFPGAEIGRLVFSPDGSQALATNRLPQSGSMLFYFSLDLQQAATSEISTANGQFNGVTLDQLFFAGNNRAYGLTNQNSYPPNRIYEIGLPQFQPDGTISAPPTAKEVQFSGLNSTPLVGGIASSPEVLAPKKLYITSFAPGQNTNLLTIDALATPPKETSLLSVPNSPYTVHHFAAAITPAEEQAVTYLKYNAKQPPLAPSARSLPFAVRLFGGTGKPLWNANVTFQTTSAGAVLQYASVTTNADGYAFNSIVAPAELGDIPVSFAVTGTAITGNFIFNMSPAGLRTRGGPQIVSGDGQIAKVSTFTQKPLKIRVLDANLNPVANETVIWSVTEGAGLVSLGTQFGAPGSQITTTDSQGYTQNFFITSIQVPSSVSSVRTTVTASTKTGSTSFYVVVVPAYNGQSIAPNPSLFMVTPSDLSATIIGKAGQVLPKAIQIRIVGSAQPFSGQPLQWVGIHPTTGNEDNLQSGPAVMCVPTAIPFTAADGIATCDLKLLGKPGTSIISIDIGGFNQRQLAVTVLPSEPTSLTITSGNNQTAAANTLLPIPLSVVLDDGAGNTFSGATVNWELVSGNATITNPTTTTDSTGKASTTVKLGSINGSVQIKATALVAALPSATFTLRINTAAGGFTKVGGDNQSAAVNTTFANPISVQVKDTLGTPLSGQSVTFAVTSGPAIVGGLANITTATTDNNGIAQVTVRAGATPGPSVITVSTAGLATVLTFTLNVQPPGPNVNPADFYNAASGERGAIVPGSLYNIVGAGLAPDLRGCITPSNFIGPIPTRLNGVEVQFGATPAPILNVCNLNGIESAAIQIPFNLSPADLLTQAVVTVNSVSQTVAGIRMVDLQPGIFETIDAQSRKYAVALKPNGTWVTPENPARYGELIRIYLTGHGPLSPISTTNQPGNAATKPFATIAMAVNTDGARVVEAHAMEGMIGVVQVTFEIPQGTLTGAARPLGLLMVRPGTQESVYQYGSPTIPIAP